MVDIYGVGHVFSRNLGQIPEVRRFFGFFYGYMLPFVKKTAVNTAAAMAEAALRADMELGQKKGRKYPHLPNISSAPGQTPAVQFGKLIRSLYWKEISEERAEVRIGKGTRYAFALEYGNPANGAAPRPMMRWIANNRALHSAIKAEVVKQCRAGVRRYGNR